MIQLHNIDGYPISVNPRDVSSIIGLRPNPYTSAKVIMANGTVHEVRETHGEIIKMLVKANAPEPRP